MALHRLLKRKGGVDELNDDFPLASPATKIRRLVSTSSLYSSPSTTNQTCLSLFTNRFRLLPFQDAELPPILEEDEPLPNEERALVLFKPLVHSPSSFSLTLDSDLMKGIRNSKSFIPSNQMCFTFLNFHLKFILIPIVVRSTLYNRLI